MHLIKTAAFAGTMALLTASAGASVIYAERFDNTTGSEKPLSDYGWRAHYGSGVAYD